MNDYLNAATSAASKVDINALSEAAGNAVKGNIDSLKKTADGVASVGAAIQDKPNLEDRVSEALLNLLTKDKFIQSMSSNISSILKTEILKPAFKEQLDKVKNIIAEVEKLECNKDKDVVNDKIKNANIVANTIKKTIDSVGAEESKNTTNKEEPNDATTEESKKTNPEESESVVDENNINLVVEEDTNAEKPVTNVEENSVQGGKVRKSRRKNTKKTRKSRRNKRRN